MMMIFCSLAFSWSSLLLLMAWSLTPTWAYVPQVVLEKWKTEGYTMEQALAQMEKGAEEQLEVDYDTYYATRFVDRQAHILYSDPQVRHNLCQKAKGSWELRMAYQDSHRDTNFYPFPDFREYAMAFIIVDDDYFGKGIAASPDYSFVSMGGPSKLNERTRQVYMDYQDFYISGNALPDWDLSFFMRGYARNWYAPERQRPPLAFTIIAVNDRVLCVRGSKTGGMALFRRVEKDMRPAAFGVQDGWHENTKGLWSSRKKRK